MRKLVKGNSTICYRGIIEHLDDYIEIFKKYFRNIAHHHHIHHGINKDAILMYSYFPIDISCEGCDHESRELDIPICGNSPISIVFSESKARDLECMNVDRILYGGKHIGFYCPKNNIFCCGDLAHDADQATHIKAVLEGMEEAGYIKPLVIDNPRIKITLGADPEMEANVNGILVSACNLPQLCTREKVYISHDGHTQPQRELRPDPANTPEELVENIRDLIRISSFFNEDLRVVGSAFPLGGHIHIGNATPSTELISVLDYFLFPFNEFNSKRRNDSKYGKPGDVRIQPHGFEYRTPPAAWLLTPTLAKMTLELTQNITEKIINNENVEISDNYKLDEYIESLKGIGFSDVWVNQFLNEISWAKVHINEPLAKTWNVEIPKEYRIRKVYREHSSFRPIMEELGSIEEPEEEEQEEDSTPWS